MASRVKSASNPALFGLLTCVLVALALILLPVFGRNDNPLSAEAKISVTFDGQVECTDPTDCRMTIRVTGTATRTEVVRGYWIIENEGDDDYSLIVSTTPVIVAPEDYPNGLDVDPPPYWEWPAGLPCSETYKLSYAWVRFEHSEPNSSVSVSEATVTGGGGLPVCIEGTLECEPNCTGTDQSCVVGVSVTGSSPQTERIHGYWVYDGEDENGDDVRIQFDGGTVVAYAYGAAITRTNEIAQLTPYPFPTPWPTGPYPTPINPGPPVCPYAVTTPGGSWSYEWRRLTDGENSGVSVSVASTPDCTYSIPWDPRCGPTWTPTPTHTPSVTPTPTATEDPAVTWTPSATPTLTPTPTNTGDPTLTLTPNPSCSSCTITTPCPTEIVKGQDQNMCKDCNEVGDVLPGRDPIQRDYSCFGCGYLSWDEFRRIVQNLMVPAARQALNCAADPNYAHCREYTGLGTPEGSGEGGDLNKISCPAHPYQINITPTPTAAPNDFCYRTCGRYDVGANTIFMVGYNPSNLLHEMYHAWFSCAYSPGSTAAKGLEACAGPVIKDLILRCGVVEADAGDGTSTPTPLPTPDQGLDERFCDILNDAHYNYRDKTYLTYIEEILANMAGSAASCDMQDCSEWMPEEFRALLSNFLECADDATPPSCLPDPDPNCLSQFNCSGPEFLWDDCCDR